MSEFEDFVKEFVAECSEGLDQLENDLVSLEQDPDDAARLYSVFRTLHTIKGNSSFFNFDVIGGLAHSGEHLLGQLRGGTLTLNSEMSDALLTLVDAIRSVLQTIAETGSEGENSYDDLKSVLGLLTEGKSAEGQSDSSAPEMDYTIAQKLPESDEATEESLEKTVFHSGPMFVQNEEFGESEETADGPKEESKESDANVEVEQDKQQVEVRDDKNRQAPESDSKSDINSDSSFEIRKDDSSSTLPRDGSRSDSSRVIASPSSSNIRVDVDLLDKMMNLVGELVLTRNQVLQFTTIDDDPVMQNASQHLNLITTELQESVMKTRMQSINLMWHKYPRIVRDLARKCGSKCRGRKRNSTSR